MVSRFVCVCVCWRAFHSNLVLHSSKAFHTTVHMGFHMGQTRITNYIIATQRDVNNCINVHNLVHSNVR